MCCCSFSIWVVVLSAGLIFLGWPSYSLSTTAFLLGYPTGLPTVPAQGAVIVTGCSLGGIGYDIAVTVAKSGHPVFCSVRKEKDKATLDALHIETLTALLMDVTKEEEIDTFAQTVFEKLGSKPLVGLVNNAGISKHAPIEFGTLEDINSVLDVNLHGVIRVTQKFIPALRQSKGRIVNIGSVRGLITTPDSGAYGMSKWALEALTSTLRQEMAYHGVSVTMINPGYIKTKIAAKQFSPSSTYHALTKEQVELYSDYLPCYASKRMKNEETAGHVSEVTVTVEHALFAAFPRYRYFMGSAGGSMPAWCPSFIAQFVPTMIYDAIVLRKMQC